MTVRTHTLALTDRVIATLTADDDRSATEVAEAVGSVSCYCVKRGHAGRKGPLDRRPCTCAERHGTPGWRPANYTDVRAILNRLETSGLVTATRSTSGPTRVGYRLAFARKVQDVLDDLDFDVEVPE